MGYKNLHDCVLDLERNGMLRRVSAPVDPYLEMACIQRAAFRAGSPALLFTNPKGCRFPMLANLFGAKERVNFIFRDAMERVKTIFAMRADMKIALRKPRAALSAFPGLWHMRPRRVPPNKAPVLKNTCALSELPKLVSWPSDGGPFITLPLVYSEHPEKPGEANLGMYRIQLSGNAYASDEVGLHYQLQRGIGIHHAKALAMGQPLAVNVHVGGPPALTVAAVMPLPEGMNELIFAGLLGGERMELARENGLPVLAQTDFVLRCETGQGAKPEGPFGDHLGYYSLKHEFPFLKVKAVQHRQNAIWPFTSVGRPPQEDTMFGDLIHELTAPMVKNVFEGVKEVHAVDAAGVHPLLLAMGSERYTAWEAARKPRELLTLAMHLLGTTQTALAKFVIIGAQEDAPDLSCRNIGAFFRHILERTDFTKDLHFISQCACDTLDYSGYGLHEGSRLIWAAAGEKKRELGRELKNLPNLPPEYGDPLLVMPGVLAISGSRHDAKRGEQDPDIQNGLVKKLEQWQEREKFPLVVIVDDARFCSASLENFLWTVFTRSDPACDSYGAFAATKTKHWQCQAPYVLDARAKAFHAPPLEDDPEVIKRVKDMAAKNGQLAGIF